MRAKRAHINWTLDIGNWTFVLCLCLTLLSAPPLFAQQQIPPYPTAYWINGTIGRGALPAGQTLDGFTVIFYRSDGTPWTAFATAITDLNGNFRLNAMDDLRMFDPTTRSLIAGDYFIGVGWREVGGVFYGVNQNDTAGDLTAADLANGSKDVGTLNLAAGQGVWSPGPLQIVTTTLPNGTPDIAYAASLIGTGGEPPYTWTLVPGSGTLPPGLNLGRDSGTIAGTPNRSGTFNFSVRLADAIGTTPAERPLAIDVAFAAGTGPRVNVRVLLRGLYTGRVAGNPQQGAANLVLEAYNPPDGNLASAAAANLVGSCVLAPVGGSPVEFTNNGVWETVPPEGDYFIVIRQTIAGATRGTNHLPIILTNRVSIEVGVPAIDLTAGSLAFTPTGRRLPAMMSFDGQNMLWPGDIDGNGYINTNDTAAWFESFRRFNADPSVGPNNQADIDGNGIINTTDTALWFETFRAINAGNFDGPHGYAPPPPGRP